MSRILVENMSHSDACTSLVRSGFGVRADLSYNGDHAVYSFTITDGVKEVTAQHRDKMEALKQAYFQIIGEALDVAATADAAPAVPATDTTVAPAAPAVAVEASVAVPAVDAAPAADPTAVAEAPAPAEAAADTVPAADATTPATN